MRREQPRTRLPKPQVGDAKIVAKMLASDEATVLRESEQGKLPAPFISCGKTVWILAEIREWVAAKGSNREMSERRTTKEMVRTTRRRPAHGAASLLPLSNKLQIPPRGNQVYAWARKMEQKFETEIVPRMSRDGEDEGWGRVFAAWTQEQVNTLCMGVIIYICGLPKYRGEFEHLFDRRQLEFQFNDGESKLPQTHVGHAS